MRLNSSGLILRRNSSRKYIYYTLLMFPPVLQLESLKGSTQRQFTFNSGVHSWETTQFHNLRVKYTLVTGH